MKRAIDILISLMALILLLPLIVVGAALIFLLIGRPVLFSQDRPGLNERQFRLYKFRTMTNERDSDGKLLADAERMTGFGRFLRRTSIDELPTLWNVLKGDMSLVGPRPLLVEYLPLYSEEQRRRHDVRPGITGWAQVNGRNAISWEDKFRYDVWYVENASILLDCRILLMTLAKVVQREGISQPGQATMSRFEGSPSEPDNGSKASH